MRAAGSTFVLACVACVPTMACGHRGVVPEAIPPAALDVGRGAVAVERRLAQDEARAREDDAAARARDEARARGIPTECEPLDLSPSGSEAAPDFSLARAELSRLVTTSNAKGIAVAVARDGQVLWEEGFGFADVARRRKATEHTMFSLASISKPITATAVMVLVQRGDVSLAAPLSTYLPGAVRPGVGDFRRVTVRRVANHTAGLPLHYQFFYDGDGHQAPARAETHRRYARTVTAPGERHRYSNLGYGLLDTLVSEVSGQPYADFVQAEVFAPMGITHASVGRPSGALRRHEALRYDDTGKALPDYGFDHPGASALYVSAHDLARFGMAHLGQVPGPLDEASRVRMRETDDESPRYGVGFGVRRRGGLQLVSHTGGMPGVSTRLTLLPEAGVVIVILTNGASVRYGRAHDMIIDALGLPQRADSLCALQGDGEIFGTWTGRLEVMGGELAMALEVRPSGEVFATFADGPPRRVQAAELDDELLRGRVFAALGSEQSEGRRIELTLELRLRGEALTGGVVARVPGVSALTHFVALGRE